MQKNNLNIPQLHNKSPVIAISGMIGVGKTTLTKLIHDNLNIEPIFEPIDNPLLTEFYKNPKEYGFSLQLWFLNQRFETMQHALWHGNKILDRHLGEDIVFGRQNFEAGNIKPADFQIYTSLLNNMQKSLRGLPKQKPDLTIFLDGNINTIMKNIQHRNRQFEQASKGDELYQYYEDLLKQYQPWFTEYTWTPKLKFDMNNLDLENTSDVEQILTAIINKLNEQVDSE